MLLGPLAVQLLLAGLYLASFRCVCLVNSALLCSACFDNFIQGTGFQVEVHF